MKKKHIKFTLILLICLVSIRFWSFGSIPDKFYDYLDTISVLVLIWIVTHEKLSTGKLKTGTFGLNISLLLILPFVSSIGAFLYHGQSFLDSFLTLRVNLYWLLYFVLHIYKPDDKLVIKTMLIFGLIWAFLNIVQQFTYPMYWFYTRSDTDEQSILRAGIYRFMPYRHHYGLFFILFFFYKYLKFGHIKYLLLVILGLAGFYYFGTRQFLAITIISLGIMLLWMNQGKWGLALFLLLGSFGTIVYFQDLLLGKFIELSKEDLTENNIRLFAYNFYYNDYWPDNLFARIIGNGQNHPLKGPYAQEIQHYEKDLRLYRTDIGIVGSYNKFGLLYVIAICLYNIQGLKNKFYIDSNKYMKLIFITSIFLFPLTIYYTHQSAIPFYCLVTYLIEKNYQNKKIEKKSKRLTNITV